MKHLVKLLCILLALLLCGCAAEPAVTTAPTTQPLQTDTLPEQTTPTVSQQVEQPPVEVIMPRYAFTYSGALAELISIREHEDGTGLLFLVKLSEQTVSVFDMYFDSQEGDFVTVLQDGQGTRVPVAFLMMEAPEGLNDEDLHTFCTVQDAVNEIVASLQLQ